MLDSDPIPEDVALWIRRIDESGTPGYYIGRATEEEGAEVYYIYATYNIGSIGLVNRPREGVYRITVDEIGDGEPAAVYYIRSVGDAFQTIHLKVPDHVADISTSSIPAITAGNPAPVLP